MRTMLMWHVQTLNAFGSLSSRFAPGVLGGSHDWWCPGCSAVWLHAVPPCPRPLREARHTQGHQAIRGWGPAGDQGGAHWAQDTGPISSDEKMTPPHPTPPHPSVIGPSSTNPERISSSHPHLLTQIPTTFAILGLNPEPDLPNYREGETAASPTILPNFTSTLTFLLLLPLGLWDEDGGLAEDLPLKAAPCGLRCGESAPPGWPGGYNCSGQGPLAIFLSISFRLNL